MHGLAVDRNRRAYVADRNNKRVQVFEENGAFLAVWPNRRFPNDVLVSDKIQDVWVSDNMTTEIIKYDTSDKRLFSWRASGTAPGGFLGAARARCGLTATLYTADNVLGRPQKLRPKRVADPSQLIGPPLALMPKVR